MSAKVSSGPESQLTVEVSNALHYAAGYVCYKFRKHLEESIRAVIDMEQTSSVDHTSPDFWFISCPIWTRKQKANLEKSLWPVLLRLNLP